MVRWSMRKIGIIEWKAVRETASLFLPKHAAAAAAAWKHRNLSHVEQELLSQMPKDRGAEQGDVDGSLGRSLALGMVAAETRGSIVARQAAGTLPWIGVKRPRKAHLCPRPAACVAEKRRLGGSMVRGRRRHHVPPNSGFALSAGLRRCQCQSRTERNAVKTEVIFYVNVLDAAPPERRIGDVRNVAKASAVTDGSITLGVAVGSRQLIADQLLGKADVIRAMHERVQRCHDPQTEFALLRESVEVSRINHILRGAHNPAGTEGCRGPRRDRALERLFPGLTEDSMTRRPHSVLASPESGSK